MTIAVAGCTDSDDDGGTNETDSGEEPNVPEEVQQWLDDMDANNADAIEDRTGEDEVMIANGVKGEDWDLDYAFDPAVVRIDEGTTVTWEWESEGHTVESEQTPGEDFDSGTPEQKAELVHGQERAFTHQFEEAGNALYYCGPHRSLGHVGAIIVE